jgi:hypothetical protein
MGTSTRQVQLDDLEEGKVYTFHLRSRETSGFVRLPFGGFISQKGKPLVVMAIREATGEVISVPADIITRIEAS